MQCFGLAGPAPDWLQVHAQESLNMFETDDAIIWKDYIMQMQKYKNNS